MIKLILKKQIDLIRKQIDLIRMKSSIFGQFKPHSLNKTKTQSCVICCGPKKSGTYLLHSIVRELNMWEDINICYFNNAWVWGPLVDRVKKNLKKYLQKKEHIEILRCFLFTVIQEIRWLVL